MSLIFDHLKDIDISFQFLCSNITDELKITKTLRVLQIFKSSSLWHKTNQIFALFAKFLSDLMMLIMWYPLYWCFNNLFITLQHYRLILKRNLIKMTNMDKSVLCNIALICIYYKQIFTFSYNLDNPDNQMSINIIYISKPILCNNCKHHSICK